MSRQPTIDSEARQEATLSTWDYDNKDNSFTPLGFRRNVPSSVFFHQVNDSNTFVPELPTLEKPVPSQISHSSSFVVQNTRRSKKGCDYPIENGNGGTSWLWNDGLKCRQQIDERMESVLWGGKWVGMETGINVYDWGREEGMIFHQGLDDAGVEGLLKGGAEAPALRIFMIGESSLQAQMSASLPCLTKLFDAYNVPPAFMEIALMTTSGSCGHRINYDKHKPTKTPGHERKSSKASSKNKPIGYDIWYELRHSFTTANTHRQLVNLHYDAQTRSTTVFFIGSQMNEVQQRIRQIFKTSEEEGTNEVEEMLEDPFSLLTVFLNLTFDDLFTIQADFDVRVWDLTSESFAFVPNACLSKANLTDVHQLASNSLRYSTQLSRLFQTTLILRSHHVTFHDKVLKAGQPDLSRTSTSAANGMMDYMNTGSRSWNAVGECVNEELGTLVEKCRDLKGWAAEREGIIQNDINLRYNMITQRDSKITASIAKDARRDSGSMRTIAVLTMVFLPGTFVSAVLGMQFTDIQMNGWQIYLAVAFPLTILTLGIWYVWQRRNDIEHRKNYDICGDGSV